MKVTRENLKDNKVKLTIDVEKDQLEKVSDSVYKKLAETVKIAGFRPGKAPKNIVVKEIGQQRFEAEILDEIIPQTYYEAVVKEAVDVVGAPEVNVVKFVPTDSLSYEAVVEVMPKVELPDITKINVKREASKIEEKEIYEVVEDLRKQLSRNQVVERASKKGDRVEINFEGFVGGTPFEGGKSDNYPLVLGSGTFIPGFEEQLEGMKAEEEKEVKVTFPKEYHSADLAGKEATFKVKMNQIEEIIMPEVTDAFATLVGPFENLKALREDIKKQLKNTKEMQARKQTEDEILEEMIKKVKFEAPKSITHQEIHRMLHEAEQNLSYQGLTLEKYLEMTKNTMEELEKQMEPEAEKRVKVGLLLTELAKEKKFTATKKELQEKIEKQIEFTPEEEKKKAKEYLESHDGQHQLENAIIGQKVMDYLYENCSK